MNLFVASLLRVRRIFTLWLRPQRDYFLATKNTDPLSAKYGFDRGTPIDRYYIEVFLAQNKQHIKGVCLEITDDLYTRRFGEDRVTRRDVLDINPKNLQANIHGDLRNLKGVTSNMYDTVILTQVLGMIDDIHAVIRECHRILKPGGALILTSSCVSPVYNQATSYWRFTIFSIRYLLQMKFRGVDCHVESYGNVLSGQCFWVGMAQEELSQDQLEINDPRFPLIIGAVAIKQIEKKKKRSTL